jgi:hypothetical protein
MIEGVLTKNVVLFGAVETSKPWSAGWCRHNRVCSTRFESVRADHIFQWVSIHNLTRQMAPLGTPPQLIGICRVSHWRPTFAKPPPNFKTNDKQRSRLSLRDKQ